MALFEGKYFANIFEQEVPSGAVNGSNTAFTLSGTPIFDKAVFVFANGVLQRQATDYTISGSSITFNSAPLSGVNLYAVYFKR